MGGDTAESTNITKQVENLEYLLKLLSKNQKDDNNYNDRFKLLNSIHTLYENNKTILGNYDDDTSDNITLYPIFFLGIIPVKTLPCAYIPFNYNKNKIEYNRNKLDNGLSNSMYVDKKIWHNIKGDNVEEYKNTIKDNLKASLEALNENDKEFVINTQPFLRNLIIIWTLVILFLKMILLYYYPFYYNYVIITIIAILLITAIILKMINTIRN